MTIKISEYELEEMFDNALDEGEIIKIGNLTYLPSQVLKNTDPIAYREGLYDYADFLNENTDYEIEM